MTHPFGKGWDDVTASQNISRVNEPKGIAISHQHKLKAINLMTVPVTTTCSISKIPSHPQTFYLTWFVVHHSWSNVYGIDVKNTQNLRISEGMKIVYVLDFLLEISSAFRPSFASGIPVHLLCVRVLWFPR